MTNPWKITTLVLAVVLGTALTSGLTTAYLLRASAPPSSIDVTPAPTRVATPELEPPRRPPIVRITRTAPSASTTAPEVAAPVTRMEPAPTLATEATEAPSSAGTLSAPAPAAPSGPPEAATATPLPDDCATGGDRAWRIAKPGALGTLVGAGVGAAGGAIADGGSGAGKGALWGSLAGATFGSAWGAYRTHQECGTIFGDTTRR